MIFFICFHVMFIIFAIFQKSFKLFVVLIKNKIITFFSYWHKNEWSNLWSLFWFIIHRFIIHTNLKNFFSYQFKIKNWNVWNCIHLFDAFIDIFCFQWNQTSVCLLFFFEWYLIFKLYLFNSKIHCTWCSLGFFVVKKYSRFL